MKRFFRDTCLINASGIAAFVMVGLYLFIVCKIVNTGSLFLQLLAIVWVLYFIGSAIVGCMIMLISVIRTIVAKSKKKSAPTEVSAE